MRFSKLASPRPHTVSRLLALLAVTGLLAACVPSSTTAPTSPGPTSVSASSPFGAHPFSLTQADSCESLATEIKDRASEAVTAWGLPYGWSGIHPMVGRDLAADGAAEDASGPLPSAGPSGDDSSYTNTQVAGVDEADYVKSDGDLVVVVSQDRLRVLSADDAELLGTATLPLSSSEMLLAGDTAVVFSHGSLAGSSSNTGASDGTMTGDRAASSLLPGPAQSPATSVFLVDLSDPANPQVSESVSVDGSYVSARMADGVVRLAVSGSRPALSFVSPETSGIRAEREALEENRRIVEDSELADWLPYMMSFDAGDNLVSEGMLLDCDSALLPPYDSGFGFSSLLSFDPSEGLDVSAVGVMSQSSTVYATASSLYLATQSFDVVGPPTPLPEPEPTLVDPDSGTRESSDTGEGSSGDAPSIGPLPADPNAAGSHEATEPVSDDEAAAADELAEADPATPEDRDSSNTPASEEPAPVPADTDSDDLTSDETASDDPVSVPARREAPEVWTDLHAFSLEGTDASYVASGRTDGRLLSSWSLSEHEGVLRVVTTSPDPESGSISSLVSLRPVDGVLTEVGSVSGLGPTERVYAVRFFGDIGFVVTFRQIDPLYALDLSNPADPKVLGELKITGYSAYLHPVSENLLMGVGQAADARGRTEGTQVSLFDVSDLSDPTLADSIVFEDTSSPVEWDHRAFQMTYSDGTATAYIPLSFHGPVTFTDPTEEGVEDDRPSPEDTPGLVLIAASDSGLETTTRLPGPGLLADSKPGVDAPERFWAPPYDRVLVLDSQLVAVSREGAAFFDRADGTISADPTWVSFRR